MSRFGEYHDYPPTKSRYLDGSYFNKVFADYPGLITEPLKINMDEETGEFLVEMKYCEYSKEHTGLLRVVVETQSARHSSLVLVDSKDNVAYWFEPFKSRLDDRIHHLIEHYLQMPVIRLHQTLPEDIDVGEADFCEAYAIKFANDYINDEELDLTDMRSLASQVESEFPRDTRLDEPFYNWDKIIPDLNEANGLLDNPRVRNALIGAGIGGLGTGLLGGGPSGVLLGAGLGALGGYALTGSGGLFH